MKRWIAAALAVAGLCCASGTAFGQEAPPQEEVMGAPAAPAGPAWRVFTQSDATSYLIDMSSIAPQGDEVRVRIARVPKGAEAGDLAHVVDEFGVRCGSGETHVVTSSDVLSDGETVETYPADEPWTPAPSGSFDESVKEIACGAMEPSRAPFPSIRAYIEAGRP